MDYLISKEKEIIENNAIIKEEKNGTGGELMQSKLTSLTDPVRTSIMKLSVLEVIA